MYKKKDLLYIIIVIVIGTLLCASKSAQSQEATLVNIFDTTVIGSSDPSGLTFLPNTGNLLLVDSEVEETPFFTGSNMFELASSFNIISKYSTLRFTDEPTGITYNTVTGTLFITSDTQRMVYEVDSFQPEVVISTFSLSNFGVNDASGITDDPTTGNLYITDGDSNTLHEFTPSGVLVESFSLPVEIRNPEGIYFDGGSGNFFIVSGPDEDVIFEVTTSGVIANIIDILSVGVNRPKGITFAPSSDTNDDPSIFNVFVADYGNDEINDGRLFEISLDGVGSTNNSPQIDSGPTATPNQILSSETAQLDVQASDVDGDPLTYTWMTLPGEGIITGTGDTVTYTPPAITVQQAFIITVMVTDGQGGSASGTVGVTVIPVGGGAEVTFPAVADTWVNSNNPGSNNGGSSTILQVDGSPTKISYLRFEVTGISGAVQSARIRLDCDNGSSFGGTIHSISDISWDESTVTYNTRPLIDGPVLDALGPVSPGDIVVLDVTSVIAGDGIYSFAFISDNRNAAKYRSREDLTNPPALIITTDEGGSTNTPPQIDSGPTATPNQILSSETAQLDVQASDVDGDPLTYTWTTLPGEGIINGTGDTVTYTPPAITVQQTFTITVMVTDGQGGSVTGTVGVTVIPVGVGAEVTFPVVADTWVQSNRPDRNRGGSTVLQVDGSPTKISYLRFEVTGISGAVQSARIRLDCVNGSGFGGAIHFVSDNSWDEGTVTYNTRPLIGGPVLDALGPVSPGDIVELDVTSAIAGDGIYSFAFVSDISNAAKYRSREDLTNPPALIITTDE